jgi:hypothetical protein
MLYKIFLFSFVGIQLIGCNYSGKLTRRYKMHETKSVGCNINQYVSVHGFLVEKDPPPPAATKSVTDLSNLGQYALVNALEEQAPEELIAKLRSNLAVIPEKKISHFVDYTKLNKRVAFVVDKLPIAEGDRIEKIWITMTILDANFKITSCNRTTTEYMNVDLGKIVYSNTNGLELTANAGMTNTGMNGSAEAIKNSGSSKNGDNVLGDERTLNNSITRTGVTTQGLAAKFNASRSMTEDVQLKQRLVALAASIDKNSLRVFEEGISGIDLTGTITADFTAEYSNNVAVKKVYSFKNLTKANGELAKQNEIKIDEDWIAMYNVNDAINAEICYSAIYRKILKNARTITESDDKIDVVYGSTESCNKNEIITLIPKDALRPKTWTIQYKVKGNEYLPLNLSESELRFSDSQNALEFLRWLKASGDKAQIKFEEAFGTLALLLKKQGGVYLTQGDLKDLRIQLED